MVNTEVVVIGGGITGCGVARDLALRGVSVTVVERDRINSGTSGRSHGLLHSGARYADGSPELARECLEENEILKRIAGDCVRSTGGYFIQVWGDADSYFTKKFEACEASGIPVEERGVDEIREQEPLLTSDAERILEVPDAVVYPSRLVAATAKSAQDHGAEFVVGNEVTDVLVDRDQVEGVVLESGDTITCDHVVNATGPWAGRVGKLASVTIEMELTRGVLVKVAEEGVNSVLNRCRPPQDGDIIVPHDTHIVIGTSSVAVQNPDRYTQSLVEVSQVFQSCAEMVPTISNADIFDHYWGVRPLFDTGTASNDAGSPGRDFHLLDHRERDDLGGFTSIVGGKLTTYRRMAEAVSDHVTNELGYETKCQTATDPLPGRTDPTKLAEFVAEFETMHSVDTEYL